MELFVDETNNLQAEVYKEGGHYVVWVYPIPTEGVTIFKESVETKAEGMETLQGWIDTHYSGAEYIGQ